MLAALSLSVALNVVLLSVIGVLQSSSPSSSLASHSSVATAASAIAAVGGEESTMEGNVDPMGTAHVLVEKKTVSPRESVGEFSAYAVSSAPYVKKKKAKGPYNYNMSLEEWAWAGAIFDANYFNTFHTHIRLVTSVLLLTARSRLVQIVVHGVFPAWCVSCLSAAFVVDVACAHFRLLLSQVQAIQIEGKAIFSSCARQSHESLPPFCLFSLLVSLLLYILHLQCAVFECVQEHMG